MSILIMVLNELVSMEQFVFQNISPKKSCIVFGNED